MQKVKAKIDIWKKKRFDIGYIWLTMQFTLTLSNAHYQSRVSSYVREHVGQELGSNISVTAYVGEEDMFEDYYQHPVTLCDQMMKTMEVQHHLWREKCQTYAEGQGHALDIPRHPTGATADHLGHRSSAEVYFEHGCHVSETASIQAFQRTMMAQEAGLVEGFRNPFTPTKAKFDFSCTCQCQQDAYY